MRQQYLNRDQKQMGNTVGTVVGMAMPMYGIGRLIGSLASKPLKENEQNTDAAATDQNKAMDASAQQNGMKSNAAPVALNPGFGSQTDWIETAMPGHTQLMGGAAFSSPTPVKGAYAAPEPDKYEDIMTKLYGKYAAQYGGR